MALLTEILSSHVRAEIFRLLFGMSEEPLHQREISRRSNLAIRTVQRELKKLERLDLVKAVVNGNRRYYQANKSHPLYNDIHNLVLKTSGLVDCFQKALNKKDIKIAFIFGSIASGEEGAESDVDLMVIGDLGLRKLTELLSGTSEKISREINPYVMNAEEFRRRTQSKEHFVSRIIESPKIFIVGNDDELKAMGR
jgi:predicted nucleotidyltransferase